jgi:hypothetical protein
MLNRGKTLEREALRKRIGELNAEMAQHERDLREGKARLPIEEQLALNLRRLVELSIPELTANIRMEKNAADPSYSGSALPPG